MAQDIALQRVYITTDCKTVVDDLKEGTVGKYSSVTSEICSRASSFEECVFVHEGRASNFEAHNLAKHSLFLVARHHIWLAIPKSDTVPVNIVIN